MELGFLMICFLLGPLFLYLALLFCFAILFVLYLLFKIVCKSCGCDQCASNFIKTMMLFSKTLWKNFLHPDVLLHKIVKTILLKWGKDSKGGNDKIVEAGTIKEGKIEEGPKLKKDTYFWVSKIPLAYYATLFTYFWPRLAYDMFYYNTGVNTDSLVIISIVYVLFGLSWIGCTLPTDTIPTNTHIITDTEVLTYLSGPVTCSAYVNIECYHSKSEAPGATTTVTTYSTAIKIPVNKWTDTTAPPCKDHLSADLTKLLSKTPFFLVFPVLQAEPAHEKSKQCLEQFRQNCVEQNKHRDRNISAAFSYKLRRDGRDVDKLVVFRGHTFVPRTLLGPGYFFLAVVFTLAGCPLPALLLLLWKVVTRKIIFKKTIQFNF